MMMKQFIKEEEKKTYYNKSRRHRPQKWEPMKFPKFALLLHHHHHHHPTNSIIDDDGRNSNNAGQPQSSSLFPLHLDVVSATLRELLILDGCIDSKSLKVLHSEEAIRRFRITTSETARTTTTTIIKNECCGQKRKHDDSLATNINANTTTTSPHKCQERPLFAATCRVN